MYTDYHIPYWNDIHGSRSTSPVDLPEVWQDDSVFGLGAELQRDQGKIMIINKALVHKGLTPLVRMFSDVSKITMFQSLNVFTGKRDDACFKIAGNKGSHESKTKQKQRFLYLFQTDFWQKNFSFCSKSRCSTRFITSQDEPFICLEVHYACFFLGNEDPFC